MLSHTTLYTFLLMLASLVAAAPVEAQASGNTWGYASGGGVVGFIVLVLDIIVFSKPSSSPPCLPQSLLQPKALIMGSKLPASPRSNADTKYS